MTETSGLEQNRWRDLTKEWHESLRILLACRLEIKMHVTYRAEVSILLSPTMLEADAVPLVKHTTVAIQSSK